MDKYLNPETVEKIYLTIETWIRAHVLVWHNLIQFAVIIALFLVAAFIAPWVAKRLRALSEKHGLQGFSRRVANGLAVLALPTIWLVLQWIGLQVARFVDWPHDLMRILISLLSAWIVIRLATGAVRDRSWARLISMVAWTIAALHIVGYFDETVQLLDDAAINVGGVRVSALLVIKSVLSLAVLLWGASLLSRLMEQRITQAPNLSPAAQVLFVKLLKIVLISLAIVLAISSVGIDLTAFAVVGGAIGLGIGFGLQKIVSNLISGVIILLDKSIKPGDVITVGETYGWINSLGARYASVVTRDGTEWLIPNEDLITQQVINWSYSSEAVRLKIPIGISYSADPRQAIALCFEAAAEEERILKDPKTNVLLKGFGDSSVDLEMRVWIRDPQNGVSNIKSAILLRVWDKFHEHDIEIPFPQRDLHIRSAGPLAPLQQIEPTEG